MDTLQKKKTARQTKHIYKKLTLLKDPIYGSYIYLDRIYSRAIEKSGQNLRVENGITLCCLVDTVQFFIFFYVKRECKIYLTIGKYCPLWERQLMTMLSLTGIHGFCLTERKKYRFAINEITWKNV